MVVRDNWIGKPVNFFGNNSRRKVKNNNPFNLKSNRSTLPVNMFRDRDRDGVYDVFDCKPLDPNRQGIIDALVGAVKGIGKGGVKSGWREGMAKPGVVEKYREKRRAAKISRMNIQPQAHLYTPKSKGYAQLPKKPEIELIYGNKRMRDVGRGISREEQAQGKRSSAFRRVMGMAPKQQKYSSQEQLLSGLSPREIERQNVMALVEAEKARRKFRRPFRPQYDDESEAQELVNTTLPSDVAEEQILSHARMKYREEQMNKLKRGADKAMGLGEAAILRLKRANPKYDLTMEFRGKKIKQLQNRLDTEEMSAKRKRKLMNQIERLKTIQEQNKIRLAQTARKQLRKAKILTATSVFPMVTPMSKSHVMGAPGQRGRPRGSLDPRYAPYGGVFGYRKAVAAQKAMFKARMRQIEMQRAQQAQPQYETQQYVPPEAQGAVPDYSQFPQEMQEMPQEQVPMPQYPQQQVQPFQYLQEPEKRPIVPVFKSSGGSPYPPVDTRPLAPSNAYSDAIEKVDAFTGRRYFAPKPKPESWIR